MRTVSSAQQTALGQRHVSTCWLVEMGFDSGTIYVADAPHDVTWGGRTYLGAGRAGSVETVSETMSSEATGMKFTLAGPVGAYLSAALGEHVQGRAVRLLLAFFDAGHRIIDDPVLEWEGRTDVMVVQEGSDSSAIVVTAENRFAVFQRAQVRRHSDADQQTMFAGDRFYEFTPAMLEKNIVWPNVEWFKRNA